MKKLLPKLWVKITAFVLMTLMTLTAGITGVGIVYLIAANAYVDDGREARQRVVSGDLFWQQMRVVEDYCKVYLESQDEKVAAVTLAPFAEHLGEANSNFFFSVKDQEGNELLNNYTSSDYQYVNMFLREIRFNERRESQELTFSNSHEHKTYIEMCEQNENHSDVSYESWGEDTNSDGSPDEYRLNIRYTVWQSQSVSITGYVKTDLTAPDAFLQMMTWMNMLINARYYLIVCCALSFLISLFLFVCLLCGAGRKEGVEGIHLTGLNKIPLDLYVVLTMLVMGMVLRVSSVSTAGFAGGFTIICDFVAVAIGWPLLLSLPLTFAARVKAGSWWKNTLAYSLLRLCKKAVLWLARGLADNAGALPLLGKAGFVFFSLAFVEFVMIVLCRHDISALLLLWFIEKLLLAAAGTLLVINLRKLEKGGQEIASGNLAYTVDMEHMLGDFKKHAENLNNISAGMQVAVEERMKSERMKTELITNVSHDIKTPLTSIVNYVDLLKKEDVTPEQTKDYIAVLDRQSSRLKKLTEDLVEASKASTGNMAVTLERVDVNLLLSQALGEYEARLSERGLEAVLTLAPQTPPVLADGRLLWRVFDNLLSNVCKYALEGTRVYLTTETLAPGTASAAEIAQSSVRVTFKNVSAYPLNISGDELMERFVRGDASRSTEGSGLGLSIAKSLTELQKGRFFMVIDGDLFKSVLIFGGGG